MVIRAIDNAEIRIIAKTVTKLNEACPTHFSARTDDGRKIFFYYRHGALRVRRYQNGLAEGNPELVHASVVGSDTDGFLKWEQILEITGIKEIPEQGMFADSNPKFQTMLESLKQDPLVESVGASDVDHEAQLILSGGGMNGVPSFRLDIRLESHEHQTITVIVQVHGHTETYRHLSLDTFIDKKEHRECLQDCALAAYENAKKAFQAF